jgi:5-formyltetrahydrofolate cyclo-ligase
VTTVSSDKARRELRSHFRALRQALSPHSQAQHADAVCRHLSNSGLLWRRGAIAAYLADQVQGELDCKPIIATLWSRSRVVVLPVVGRQRGIMDLYRYQPETRLIRNRYDIAEPEPGSAHVSRMSCSVMLVPLVAFDDYGTRMGMGGGYYDRFIGQLPSLLRPRLVGVAHEVQRSTTPLPRADWDVPLDDIVTESGWQSFRPQSASEHRG